VAWVAAEAVNCTVRGNESLGLSVAGKAVAGVRAKLFSPYICGAPTVTLVAPWYVNVMVTEVLLPIASTEKANVALFGAREVLPPDFTSIRNGTV